jgi:CheY-like chemotaxis protein
MLSDMPAFELQERFRLYPNVKNVPFFVLIKDTMKEAEKSAIAKDVAHLVRKKWLNQEEFLAFLRRRG